MLYLHLEVKDMNIDSVDVPVPPQEHISPLCTQPASGRHLGCHADLIQLLRARYRLADLSYALLGLHQTPEEDQTREDILAFLRRRYLDNTALTSERPWLRFQAVSS